MEKLDNKGHFSFLDKDSLYEMLLNISLADSSERRLLIAQFLSERFQVNEGALNENFKLKQLPDILRNGEACVLGSEWGTEAVVYPPERFWEENSHLHSEILPELQLESFIKSKRMCLRDILGGEEVSPRSVMLKSKASEDIGVLTLPQGELEKSFKVIDQLLQKDRTEYLKAKRMEILEADPKTRRKLTKDLLEKFFGYELIIPQDIANTNGIIFDRLLKGVKFVFTRHGRPKAELVPLEGIYDSFPIIGAAEFQRDKGAYIDSAMAGESFVIARTSASVGWKKTLIGLLRQIPNEIQSI